MPQVTRSTAVQEEIQDKTCNSQQMSAWKEKAMQHQHAMWNRAAKLYYIVLCAMRIARSIVFERYTRNEDKSSKKLCSVETILE